MHGMTYQQIIRTYAHSVGDGHSDNDLTKRQARICQVILNTASNTTDATCLYPPTDQTRDAVVKYLVGELRGTLSILIAVGDAVTTDYDIALHRALECLRGM